MYFLLPLSQHNMKKKTSRDKKLGLKVVQLGYRSKEDPCFSLWAHCQVLALDEDKFAETGVRSSILGLPYYTGY